MILIALYIVAMVAANLLVWKFGPWFSPINAFFLIGLDLTLRDKIHDRFNGSYLVMGGVVLAASLITYGLNPAADKIAIASAVSFGVAAAVDWAVYGAMRKHPFLLRANGSNVVGAGVDSLLFPTIAFGGFLPHIVALQFAAKVAGGALWSLILKPKAA